VVPSAAASTPPSTETLALYGEQPLDDTLRLLVASLAEVVVTDDALRVDEVQRWPVVVGEGAPDPVAVVDRDRVIDRAVTRFVQRRTPAR
jgi:hypothetical protein